TNGSTTLFTNHMRSSMANTGCSGTTVARVASSRSGWRCIRGRTWASEAGDCCCRDGRKGNHATHDNQDREARRHQFHPGQTHFVKSVEAIHEALVAAVPSIKFGLAFCEASGKCLVRWSGTDPAMTELAKKNAAAIAAGHSFVVFLGDGFYPLNVLNTLKMVPEVCRIFCATANPTEAVLAETEQGRGILG